MIVRNDSFLTGSSNKFPSDFELISSNCNKRSSQPRSVVRYLLHRRACFIANGILACMKSLGQSEAFGLLPRGVLRVCQIGAGYCRKDGFESIARSTLMKMALSIFPERSKNLLKIYLPRCDCLSPTD